MTKRFKLGVVIFIFASCSSQPTPQPISTMSLKPASAKPVSRTAKASKKIPEKKYANCEAQNQCASDGLCRILSINERGYCSIFCASDSECPDEWSCDTDVGMNNQTFCRKPDEVHPVDLFAGPKEKGEWAIEFVIRKERECRVVLIGGETYGGCRSVGGKWGGDAFDFFGRSAYEPNISPDSARKRLSANIEKMRSSPSTKIKDAVKLSFLEMFGKEGEREKYSLVNIANHLSQIEITRFETPR